MEKVKMLVGVKEWMGVVNMEEEMVKKEVMEWMEEKWKRRGKVNVGWGGKKE